MLVKTSDIHGLGVFADKDFENDEWIGVIRRDHNCPIHSTFDGWCKYINSSDDPNIEPVKNRHNKIAFFRTLREIKEGEEITYTYGIDPFEQCDCKEK